MSIPFVTLAEPRYGEPVQLTPRISRLVAENPSKFTYHGTGTYIVGEGRQVAVIDPGPRLDSHRDALATALRDREVIAICVTHCHADHSPLAAWLAAETGAVTVGFGPHPRLDDPDADEPITGDGAAGGDDAGPSSGTAVVEETTDYDFEPQQCVGDGELAVAGPGFTLRAVHTPGHTSNHLCFALTEDEALFTGDHVMGWSTTVIAPPDGDMAAYFESLRRVMARHDRVLWPTHGAPVTEPGPYLEAFLAHRLEREAQVLAAVRSGRAEVAEIVKLLYADVREELHKPAGRSVLAHLVKLVADGVVAIDDGARPSLTSRYRPV
jgi:glyoxylase-like metal-dependent hydrolase (beta-lactamase superfamily II)